MLFVDFDVARIRWFVTCSQLMFAVLLISRSPFCVLSLSLSLGINWYGRNVQMTNIGVCWRSPFVQRSYLAVIQFIWCQSVHSIDRPKINSFVRISKNFSTPFSVYLTFHSLCERFSRCVWFLFAVDNKQRQWFSDNHLACDSQKFKLYFMEMMKNEWNYVEWCEI